MAAPLIGDEGPRARNVTLRPEESDRPARRSADANERKIGRGIDLDRESERPAREIDRTSDVLDREREPFEPDVARVRCDYQPFGSGFATAVLERRSRRPHCELGRDFPSLPT